MNYIGFFDREGPVLKTVDAKGNPRTFLDVFSDVLSEKLSLKPTDKDLVVMKHIFTLENKQGVRWTKTSEFIAVGKPEAEGG